VATCSRFPSLVCPRCRSLLDAVREFFVVVNEGQARLADVANGIGDGGDALVAMPNWEGEKETLFKDKYPAAEKRNATAAGSGAKRARKRTTKVSLIRDQEEKEESESEGQTKAKRRRKKPKR
jgi:hypothetical protein